MRSKVGATSSATRYALAFEKSARAEWDTLDGSVKEPLRKALKARLDNPVVPGSAWRGDLAGCYKIKLQKLGYRLIYRMLDDKLIVLVISVAKRNGEAVYKAAIKRLRDVATRKRAI